MVNLDINFRNRYEKLLWRMMQITGNKLIFDYNTKPFVRYVKHMFGDKPLIGAEIGVCHGDNAIVMLKTLNLCKLYLVDGFELYDDYKPLVPGATQSFYDVEYHKLLDRMKDHSNVKILKMMSNEAYKNFEDNSFDMIYIDANHSRKYIIEDFDNWYPKIKIGGILGGHGFNGHYSLFMGITEICRKYDLKVDGTLNEFWFVKDKEIN